MVVRIAEKGSMRLICGVKIKERDFDSPIF